MQCETVIRKVSGVLNDPEKTTWTRQALIDYLNSAVLMVVSVRPDASVVVGPVTLVNGVRQTLPDGGHRIVDVFHNGNEANPGAALWKTEREIKNRAQPGWMSEAPASVTDEIVLDEHFPDSFWCSPPAIAGNEVTIGYTVAPTPITNSTETFPLLTKYEPHVLEWMLYLAFSRDGEETPNGARAAAHKNTCFTMLGLKVQADRASSPSVRKKGAD